MVFTSFQFILLFLPLTFLGYVLAERFGGWKWAINFLAFASLAFYAFWGGQLLLILLVSLVFNYAAGNLITRAAADPHKARLLLLLSIGGNLALLGYLKYTNFFIDIASQLAGIGLSHQNMIAPVGVSFFTFIQIGYLIDSYNGQLMKHDFGRYVVFSAFFPCVTAGPLVMQKEMMEQMERPPARVFDLRRLMVGLTMFGMGLFKKVVLADAIAPYADQMFDAVRDGMSVDMATAWLGAVCYALQLYFDFSGYTDMAIGIGTVFGIKLPLNFDSPFKATNISDFWRRWHMTMTRFFTNYIYSNLAMNGMRKSAKLQYGRVGRFMLVGAMPAIVTFLIAGVWHGAGWTFAVYGLIHGCAIASFLAWREFSKIKLPAILGWSLTMSVVVFGLVMFRAESLSTAGTLYGAMLGLTHSGANAISLDQAQALSLVILLGTITQLLPNTQQILHLEWPIIDAKPSTAAFEAGLLAWRPALGTAVVSALLFTVALTSIGTGSNFLYYKF